MKIIADIKIVYRDGLTELIIVPLDQISMIINKQTYLVIPSYNIHYYYKNKIDNDDGSYEHLWQFIDNIKDVYPNDLYISRNALYKDQKTASVYIKDLIPLHSKLLWSDIECIKIIQLEPIDNVKTFIKKYKKWKKLYEDKAKTH